MGPFFRIKLHLETNLYFWQPMSFDASILEFARDWIWWNMHVHTLYGIRNSRALFDSSLRYCFKAEARLLSDAKRVQNKSLQLCRSKLHTSSFNFLVWSSAYYSRQYFYPQHCVRDRHLGMHAKIWCCTGNLFMQSESVQASQRQCRYVGSKHKDWGIH